LFDSKETLLPGRSYKNPGTFYPGRKLRREMNLNNTQLAIKNYDLYGFFLNLIEGNVNKKIYGFIIKWRLMTPSRRICGG